jgi:hypothetical protein
MAAVLAAWRSDYPHGGDTASQVLFEGPLHSRHSCVDEKKREREGSQGNRNTVLVCSWPLKICITTFAAVYFLLALTPPTLQDHHPNNASRQPKTSHPNTCGSSASFTRARTRTLTPHTPTACLACTSSRPRATTRGSGPHASSLRSRRRAPSNCSRALHASRRKVQTHSRLARIQIRNISRCPVRSGEILQG